MVVVWEIVNIKIFAQIESVPTKDGKELIAMTQIVEIFDGRWL